MACQEIFALFSPSLQRHRAILIYGPLVRPGNRRHRRGNADMQLTQEGSQTHVCQRLLASYLIYWLYLAAPQGFEPRYADPESAVLPLNEGAAGWFCLVCCVRASSFYIRPRFSANQFPAAGGFHSFLSFLHRIK